MDALPQFLELLFDPEDEVFVSNSAYAYHSIAQKHVLADEITLVSQNPDIGIQNIPLDELTHIGINAGKGFRSDSSVTKLRTFLLEIDTGSLQSQYEYIKKLGFPYSCMVFSGSKSLHTAIVLEDPEPDEKVYRHIYQWILNIGQLFDQQVKNPSRCIRFPGNLRPETAKEQKLVKLGKRVKIEDLKKWLDNYEECKPKIRRRKDLTKIGNFDKLSLWAQKIMKTRYIDFKRGRNSVWYSLFYDFAQAGYNEEEAIVMLRELFHEESDFKEREWLTCCNSAYKHVLRD